MKGYLYAWLVFQVLGLGIVMAKHGKPKEGNYNFFMTFIAEAIGFTLLCLGGAFDKL